MFASSMLALHSSFTIYLQRINHIYLSCRLHYFKTFLLPCLCFQQLWWLSKTTGVTVKEFILVKQVYCVQSVQNFP